MANNTDDLCLHFEKQLDRVNSWLSFGEAKNAAIIAFNIALIAVFAQLYSNFPLLCTILMSLFIFSSLLSLWSFVPILTNKIEGQYNMEDDLNLVYWADIAKISTAEIYIKKTIQKYKYMVTEEDAIDSIVIDLAKEIIINSRIALRKYDLFKKALYVDIFILMLSVIILVIA